ncbi:hypothetical protein [Cytobacillus sp. IB215316]|nr:hypothetical protein [Cytobacillus sp. IB215316]MDX8363029.1 hypothetical protein [Cytobacillus sp. IB215316]
MMAHVAATTYVRIKRRNKDDISVVIDLLNLEKYSVTEGTLEALGYDRMCPDIIYQDEIIEKCFSFGRNRKKTFTDPRYGLAAACAGWESNRVTSFLQDCLQSNDTPLIYVAKNSLKRKYVRLR